MVHTKCPGIKSHYKTKELEVNFYKYSWFLSSVTITKIYFKKINLMLKYNQWGRATFNPLMRRTTRTERPLHPSSVIALLFLLRPQSSTGCFKTGIAFKNRFHPYYPVFKGLKRPRCMPYNTAFVTKGTLLTPRAQSILYC